MGYFLYNREHHQKIDTILQSLDSETLYKNGCLFGGGTAISLKYGEFRESVGMDFIVSGIDGYRNIRSLVDKGFNSITTSPLELARESTADQYGIRTGILVDGTPVKFEIVLEARIQLDKENVDTVSGVYCLSRINMATVKILANDDRGKDPSVTGRDVIDLIMLDLSNSEYSEAMKDALSAYSSAERKLKSTCQGLLDNPDTLKEYMKYMDMDLDLTDTVTAGLTRYAA